MRTRSRVRSTISSCARSISATILSISCMRWGVYNSPMRHAFVVASAVTAALVAQAFRPARAGSPEGLRYATQQSSGTNLTLTAVPGIKVGHVTLTERPTGCTAILVEAGATAGVDVRGAAPASAETDLLKPVNLVQQIYAISLSGGSAFGLDSRSRIVRYLAQKYIRFKAYRGTVNLPILP